jgi:hypothetical protein
MKFQLVLQWSTSSVRDHDHLIEIEDALMDSLDEDHIVDGHDFGSGQVNIFLYTDQPDQAFNQVKDILQKDEVWSRIRVAYREASGSEYVVIWPETLRSFDII